MSATMLTVDGRLALRFERRLAHPRAKVWRAITDPAHLSEWFPTEVAIDLRPGGRVRFGVFGQDGEGSVGTVTEVDPPRLVAFTWSDDLLRFELTERGDGCLLVLTHLFDDRAGAASFASGWTVCLDGLDAVLEGRPVPEARPSAALHDAFVASLGIGGGTLDESAAGWRVRFERQLTAPADSVWALLCVGRAPAPGDPVPVGFTAAGVEPAAVAEVEGPGMLTYDWRLGGRPAGRVRWELSDAAGTGHGARLVLTQTGDAGHRAALAATLDAWQQRIDDLAGELSAREVSDLSP